MKLANTPPAMIVGDEEYRKPIDHQVEIEIPGSVKEDSVWV